MGAVIEVDMSARPDNLETSSAGGRYASFAEFYPFYLSEHSNATCRRLHLLGSALVLATLVFAITTRAWWALALLPVIGYGFAWAGHFFFQKNRPATFTYPLYSLAGDWVMLRDVLTGRIKF
jgi:hypothetical protein